LVLLFCASVASAQSCPDFYRFVDFGLTGSDGVTYRGGVVLRAEGFDGAPLLLTDQTVCRDVRDLAVDGRGNPIPVVTAIRYDPQVAGVDVAELGVALFEDTAAAADENAAAHMVKLADADVILKRGDDFLCATLQGRLSCQVQPPFPNQAPVVAYCEKGLCQMPVIAINEYLAVNAVWNSDVAEPAAIGADASQKARQIHDFLVPLSAAF
jgi:hypothetical protein